MTDHISKLKQKGVLIDDLGLLKPDIDNFNVIKSKISKDLITTKHAVDKVRAEGKHVLYMPGSYDLIHAGHAFYIDKVCEWYLSLPENSSLNRSDLCVLVLADDDKLISEVKASKWIGAGGTELFKRPIQSQENFKRKDIEHNWRLIELASIPHVDLVGFIPAPTNSSYLAKQEVLSTQKLINDLHASLDDLESNKDVPLNDIKDLRKAIQCYEIILQNFNLNHSKIVELFENKDGHWSVPGWQLFIHAYLASGDFLGPFVRVTSESDVNYKHQVNFVMEVTGIKNLYINDESLISTTDLLKQYGHIKLLDSKNGNYIE